MTHDLQYRFALRYRTHLIAAAVCACGWTSGWDVRKNIVIAAATHIHTTMKGLNT